MKNKKNTSGFTMVELLAVIVILGILSIISIAAIQGVIARARTEYYKTQKNNLVMAAQSYLNANKNYQPKVSGQRVQISLKTLYENKYIDKVVDYHKNACYDTETYVQAYRYKDELNYYAYLKCPDYDPGKEQEGEKPNISLLKFDGGLNAPVIKLEADAGNIKDGNQPIIANYTYTIYKNGTQIVSKTVTDGSDIGKTSLNKTISFDKKYLPGTIKVTVTIGNNMGLSTTKSVTSGDEFRDTTPPKCETITGASTNWVTGKRIITVGCSDPDTGCKQSSYTKEFSGDKKVENIRIYNNDGGYIDCPVNVYIDNTKPTLTINVYKRTSTGGKEGSAIHTITANNASSTKELTISQNTVNGWLNNSKYPYGVYIEAKYEDSISPITKLEWKWNSTNLLSTSGNAKTFTDTNTTVKTPNVQSGTDHFGISAEGWRYTELSVYDSVNHKTTVRIIAPIDRTGPSKSTSGESTTWIKNDRTINLTCTDALSGCEKATDTLKYTSTKQTANYTIKDKAGNTSTYTANVYVDKTPPVCGTKENENITWKKSDQTVKVGCTDSHSNCTKQKFEKTFNTDTKEGIITIQDNAGNTANCSVKVFVDKTGPICGTKTENNSWRNTDFEAKVQCKDSFSGCEKATYSQKFTTTTTTANITLKDNVGNTTNCLVNIKIDRDVPACGNPDGASETWTKNNRTIKQNCTDTGGSGCNPVSKTYSTTTQTDTIQLKDGAGNTRNCTVNVYVDKTKPSVWLTLTKVNDNGSKIGNYSSGEWSTNRVHRVINRSDANSGIARVEWSKDKSSWSTENNADSFDYDSANQTRYYRSVDNAGNYSDVVSATFKVDRKAPTTSAAAWAATSKTCTRDETTALNNNYVLYSTESKKKFWAGIVSYHDDDNSGVNQTYVNEYYGSSTKKVCGRRYYDSSAWRAGGSRTYFGCDTGSGKSREGHMRYYSCDNAGNCAKSKEKTIKWSGIYNSWATGSC